MTQMKETSLLKLCCTRFNLSDVF